MLRTFRAQLIISFFLVILITPLLFLLLFYPTYGRYVLARKIDLPLVSHAQAVAVALVAGGRARLSLADAEPVLRSAQRGTPFHYMLLDPEGWLLLDTRVAPGTPPPRRRIRLPESEAVRDGAPSATTLHGAVHRAAVPVMAEGRQVGILLISREYPHSSPDDLWAPGRYVRAGKVDSPLQNHAAVVANVIAGRGRAALGSPETEALLRAVAQGTPYRLVLVDLQRRVLADTAAPPERRPRATLHLPECDAVLFRGALGSTGMEGYVHRAVVPVVVDGERVGALLTAREFRAPSPFDPLALLIRVGICLVISGVVGLVLSRRLLRPVQPFTAAADALADGDLSQRVAMPPHGEWGHLAERFNHMAQHVEELVNRLSSEHERLRVAHAALAESERRQRELIANLSHEFRTPLACIRASAEAILDGVAADEAKRQRCLQTIEEETESLARLVSDLLTLSRIDQGELPLQREEIAVPRLLARCANRFATHAAARGVALEWSCPEGVTVTGDEERLAQVVSNLLDNALRYTDVAGRVRLEAATANGHVCLRVMDTGQGIAPEHLPYVFERLYRAERSRHKGSGGAGLGLAIAREITEAHGGTIHIESQPRAGTTVTLTLPGGPARPVPAQ